MGPHICRYAYAEVTTSRSLSLRGWAGKRCCSACNLVNDVLRCSAWDWTQQMQCHLCCYSLITKGTPYLEHSLRAVRHSGHRLSGFHFKCRTLQVYIQCRRRVPEILCPAQTQAQPYAKHPSYQGLSRCCRWNSR